MMTLIISFTYHDCVLVPGWAADSPPPRRRTWSWSWSRRSCGRPVRGPRSGPASAPRHSWLIDCARGKHQEILIWSERVCRWHLSDTYFLIDDHCTATLLLCRCAVLRIRDDKKHHTGAHVNPIVFRAASTLPPWTKQLLVDSDEEVGNWMCESTALEASRIRLFTVGKTMSFPAGIEVIKLVIYLRRFFRPILKAVQ